jgi:Asp-tRNA(Asn)/Glu-tRNA(Gln) amidotransferase A subunit family amidase
MAPQDIALLEPPPLVIWGTTLVVLAVTILLAFRKKEKEDRQLELRKWIVRARRERAEKQHFCLEKATDLKENDVELLTATETRDLIASGDLDPSDHVVRLAKRCRQYGRDERRANAITEEFYDEAFEASEKIKVNGKKGGVLAGVPISVKDCIGLKGAYSTGGFACRLQRRDTEDSLIIQVLKSAGALPLCRGNVPQIMMIPESVNRIYGRSRNPWNLRRTPGGSSGGDGALVAMRCVPLAICSDVAGSIRIPAAFCGVTGFKPTSTRVSNKGNMRPRKVALHFLLVM